MIKSVVRGILLLLFAFLPTQVARAIDLEGRRQKVFPQRPTVHRREMSLSGQSKRLTAWEKLREHLPWAKPKIQPAPRTQQPPTAQPLPGAAIGTFRPAGS